jgi:hypothetical protein
VSSAVAVTDVERRSTSLYALAAEYLSILDLLDDPDADEHALETTLDAIAGAITHKAESIAGLIAECEGLATIRKTEAQRLKDRADVSQRHADRLRAYLLQQLQVVGTERIETGRFTISVKTNPPAVEVVEPMLVPAEFIRTSVTTSIDKKAVIASVKATGEIPDGIEIVRKQRLSIA